MKLQQAFENTVENYVYAFFRKHGFFDEYNGEYSDFDWVGDEVGGVLCVADYYIGFDDIRYDIDNCIPKDKFFEWYEFQVEGEKSINYKSYLKGAR